MCEAFQRAHGIITAEAVQHVRRAALQLKPRTLLTATRPLQNGTRIVDVPTTRHDEETDMFHDDKDPLWLIAAAMALFFAMAAAFLAAG
jgi:hypothetical protein